MYQHELNAGHRPLLSRVKIRNFKSIARCEVSLRPLTVLVGRNGAGKSNFLEALKFVADALDPSIDHALWARGGIDDVRRRSRGHPRNFAVELAINLSGGRFADYGFEIAARKGGGFAIKDERLSVRTVPALGGVELATYRRREGKVLEASVESPPPVLSDRLYLANAAGLPEFREVYDALLSMGFYNFNPEAIKELQSPDAGELLHPDGSNTASVISRLRAEQPTALARIKDYLQTIVPEIEHVERKALGPKETLIFKQRPQGADRALKFYASSMSDGTLRALAALVAVTQLVGHAAPIKLVGIEEPETALHPAAAGALMDALREASKQTQVLVTSHSPDLLDQLNLDVDGLLVVTSERGPTVIAPPDVASREAIRTHLYSAGELLRNDQLEPDRADVERQEQMQLFADPPETAAV